MINKFVSFFLNLLPTYKAVVFESIPNRSDSVINVYNYLKELGYDKKYKFVWYGELKGIKKKYAKFKGKYLISSNDILYTYSTRQKSVYIMHGATAKDISQYYCFNHLNVRQMDYCICQSKDLEEMCRRTMNMTKEGMVSIGLPRNDDFFKSSNISLKDVFGEYKKYIFWYPTAQPFSSEVINQNSNYVQFFNDPIKLKLINEFCKSKDILLCIKAHHAVKHFDNEDETFSNVVFFNNSLLEKLDVRNYTFLAKADALITDYSSVFYDYLLVKKPICFVWNDIELYKKDNGLSEEFLTDYYRCGSVCYKVEDLLNFLANISENKEPNKKDREEITERIYGKNPKPCTPEVCDFIINYFGLKL